MPLIPRDGGPRLRIEITETIDPYSVGDWYEIRTMLGYHARLTIETAAMQVQVPANRVNDASILNSDEMVTVKMNNADVAFLRLNAWLVAWSHKEDISANTIRRIPASHAQEILRHIRELEKLQGGPSKDSPLADASKPSSNEP